MGKYLNLEEDIFSVFSSSEWIAENIKTFPSNFVEMNGGNTYIRVSIIPSGTGINEKSISGIVIIDIYTPAGNGPKAATLIADTLDSYLQNKSISLVSGNVTQFLQSSFAPKGRDRDTKSLYVTNYTIPFNYFGV